MGDKVTINGKEYDSDEVAKLISQGEDYTKKTQALSEKENLLGVEVENLKEYKELDNYLKQHPDFAPKLNKFIKSDVAERYGQTPTGGGSPAGQGGQSNQNLSGVQGSDYTPAPSGENINDGGGGYPTGYIPGQGTGPLVKPEDKPMTRKEFEEAMAEKDRKTQVENTNKDINVRLSKEYEVLREKGYTEEEMKKVVSFAQKNSRWFVESAKQLAFDGQVPNRFKPEGPPVLGDKDTIPPKGFSPLKGQPGSGYDIPDPEKDLVKYGNNPAEYLRAHPEKFIKE